MPDTSTKLKIFRWITEITYDPDNMKDTIALGGVLREMEAHSPVQFADAYFTFYPENAPKVNV